jgi:hypothetical protein
VAAIEFWPLSFTPKMKPVMGLSVAFLNMPSDLDKAAVLEF